MKRYLLFLFLAAALLSACVSTGDITINSKTHAVFNAKVGGFFFHFLLRFTINKFTLGRTIFIVPNHNGKLITTIRAFFHVLLPLYTFFANALVRLSKDSISLNASLEANFR